MQALKVQQGRRPEHQEVDVEGIAIISVETKEVSNAYKWMVKQLVGSSNSILVYVVVLQILLTHISSIS